MGNYVGKRVSREDEGARPVKAISEDLDSSVKVFNATKSIIIKKNPRQKSSTNLKRERLANVFVKPLEGTESFTFPVHEKTENEVKLIEEAIENNFIFKGLESGQRTTLVKAFEKHSVRANGIIIKEGETGDYFYIVATGRVSFSIGGKTVGAEGTAASFGDLALLYDSPRAATCTASEATELWRVGQNTFRQILAKMRISGDQEFIHVLQKVPFLKDIEKKYLNTMASAASLKTYKKGEVIIKKGDEGDVFYIIQEGRVVVTDIEYGGNAYDDQVLKAGSYFGERAIVKKEPRVANVTTTQETSAYCISREVFLKVLGPLEDLISKSNDIRNLRSIPAMARSDISDEEYIELVSRITEKSMSKGAILYSEGEETPSGIYFLRRGKVEIKGSNSRIPDTIITPGGYFGVVDTLLPATNKALSTATLLEDSQMGFVIADNIESVIQDLSRLSSMTSVRSLKTQFLQLDDLKKHCILGVGTFGKVWLVSHTRDGKTDAYALKIQKKRMLMKNSQVKGVIREMKLMTELNHPFIIRLANVYQTADSLYMLIKLVQGGELYGLMTKKAEREEVISEKDGRFYASCVLAGLAYMHRRQIIYRDLKPENILIDKNGYAIIIDLGFAKVVKKKTFTLCGTPWYIAPEVVLGRGHDKGCDYWSWAILVHEMSSGVNPFDEFGANQMSLFKAISKGKKTIAQGLSEECQDLIKQILVPKSSYRLGCLAGGDKDIREHPWLAKVNFTKLIKKQFRAPWKPDVKDALDVSQFDDWDEEMDTLDTDAPLSNEEQEQFKEVNDIMN